MGVLQGALVLAAFKGLLLAGSAMLNSGHTGHKHEQRLPSHNIEKPQSQYLAALWEAQRRAIAALQKTGLSTAVAESCTGGLLAKTLTDAAGSSAWFDCGIVTYSNIAKQRLLNVPSQLIEESGAVSEAVAAAMAEGMLEASSASITAAITGIAGPGGGSEEKPVGTVCIASHSAKLQTVKTHQYQGSRDDIRIQSATDALLLLEQQSQIFSS